MRATIPNHEQIRFSGFVPELPKALENRIMVVPLWVGSGIRSKILSAWGASCPVVSTSIGAEGLPGVPGRDFVLADNAQAFARACVDLSKDTAQLSRIAANGLELVKEHYSLKVAGRKRLEVYEKLLAKSRTATSLAKSNH
jgi:glycosyltransferase involved in cell wall biosynthesis